MNLMILLGVAHILVALLVGALAVPLVRGWIPPNPLYGVRFASSFASEENWYRINRYGGRRILGWSVVLAAIGVAAMLAPPGAHPAVSIVLAFAPVLYVIPCVQSYRFGRSL